MKNKLYFEINYLPKNIQKNIDHIDLEYLRILKYNE